MTLKPVINREAISSSARQSNPRSPKFCKHVRVEFQIDISCKQRIDVVRISLDFRGGIVEMNHDRRTHARATYVPPLAARRQQVAQGRLKLGELETVAAIQQGFRHGFAAF